MALTAEEAEFLLKEAIAEEQRRLRTLLAPFIDALTEILARKGPSPIKLPDGRILVYRGPTAADYRAPGWLEALCRDDMRFAEALRRYREHLGEVSGPAAPG